jgi:hypothetical protein
LAVIRAIQSLAEVGFDQVLDALEELRQGPAKPRPTGKSGTAPLVIQPARTPVASEPEDKSPKRPVVAEENPTEPVIGTISRTPETVETSSDSSEMLGISSASSETKTNETDEQELIPTDPPATSEAPDLNQLWIDIVTDVRKSRPLIQQYFTVAVPVSLLHRELRLGFASEHSMAMETLLRPNNRKYIEQLLGERLGQPTSIRGETRDDLVPIIFPDKAEPATNAEDNFKNDPLIQKALEIFQAEIQAAD